MLADYTGCGEVLCVNSATAGLELMLRWFGVGPGDEVIVPAYTYAATANVVVHCGAKPVLVDINSEFNIDPRKIREAVTSKTKAIIPVDLAGWPCAYDEINALVKNESVRALFKPASENQKQLGRIMILTDAAHSLGAFYKGIRTGVLSDVTVFSFHAVKNLTTGEGGAVCLNLPGVFDKAGIKDYLRIKSLHGQTKDAYSKSKLGGWKYDIIEPGYKFNMTDFQAAMGIVELQRYDSDMLIRRKQIFELYSRLLSQYEWAILPPFRNGKTESSYHVFLLRIKGLSEEKRDKVIGIMTGKGVSVNVHYIPLPMMTYYKTLGYNINDYPVSLMTYRSEISLPVYYDLTDRNVEIVVRELAGAVEALIGR